MFSNNFIKYVLTTMWWHAVRHMYINYEYYGMVNVVDNTYGMEVAFVDGHWRVCIDNEAAIIDSVDLAISLSLESQKDHNLQLYMYELWSTKFRSPSAENLKLHMMYYSINECWAHIDCYGSSADELTMSVMDFYIGYKIYLAKLKQK